MSIVDDFSRKILVVLLKSKDEDPKKFKIWVTLFENQTKKRVKRLNTNNGLEFFSLAFKKYYKSKWITKKLIVLSTPQ